VMIRVNGTLSLHSSPKKVESSQPHMSPTQTPKANGKQPISWPPSLSSSHAFQGPSVPPRPQHSPQRLDQARPMAPAPAQQTVYSGPYGPYPNAGSPALSNYPAPRLPSSHAFSSPLPHSLTSLPPPSTGQPQLYTWVNGSSPQNNHNVSNQPVPQNTPVQQHGTVRYPFNQASPSIPAHHGHGASLSSHAVHGTRPGSSASEHRRSSINLSSPLSGVPVLTPSNNTYPGTSFPAAGSPAFNSTASPHPAKSSPLQVSSPPVAQQERDAGHTSALPPAATGISPTKHSPPRLSTSNGSFGSSTPSVLPPVSSLTPSPQHQNLTPPVKPAEPERALPNGQTVAP